MMPIHKFKNVHIGGFFIACYPEDKEPIHFDLNPLGIKEHDYVLPVFSSRDKADIFMANAVPDVEYAIGQIVYADHVMEVARSEKIMVVVDPVFKRDEGGFTVRGIVVINPEAN